MSNQLILTHTKSWGARALKIVLMFVFPSFLPSTNLINEHYEELSVCSVVFACFCCSFCVPDHPLMIVNFHLLFLLSNSFARYWSGKYPLFFFFFFLPPEHGNVGKCLVQDDAHWWESWSVFHPVKHCKWSVKTSLSLLWVCQILVTSKEIAFKFWSLQKWTRDTIKTWTEAHEAWANMEWLKHGEHSVRK